MDIEFCHFSAFTEKHMMFLFSLEYYDELFDFQNLNKTFISEINPT